MSAETIEISDRIGISAIMTGQERVDEIWTLFGARSQMTPLELRNYIWEHVPWLLDERTRYRTELERLADAEPAHRARIRSILNGETS